MLSLPLSLPLPLSLLLPLLLILLSSPLSAQPTCSCQGLPPRPFISSSTFITIHTLSFHSEEGYTDLAVCNTPEEEEEDNEVAWERERKWGGEGVPVVFDLGYNCSYGGGEERGNWKVEPGCDWDVENPLTFDDCKKREKKGGKKRREEGKCRKVKQGGCGGGYEENSWETEEEKRKVPSFSDSCALECETTIKIGKCQTFRMFFPRYLKQGAMPTAIKTPIGEEGALCTVGCFVGPSCEDCVL